MTETPLLLLLVYLSIVVYSIYPVTKQLRMPKIQHLVFGSAAAVAILWWFRTGIYPGLDIHFLWLTALTLILGWRWAYVSSLISLSILVGFGIVPWQELGVIGVFGVLIPISFSYLAYTFAFKHLPRHFFVYTFFCGFFIGAMTIALKMFCFASYLYFSGQYQWSILVDNYLILIPLLLFPEGLLNGMTMTILVIYKSHWVKTFYDSQYLDGK